MGLNCPAFSCTSTGVLPSDSITVDQGKVRRKAQAIFDVNYSEVCNIVEQRSTTRDRLMTQSSDHVAKDTAFHKSNDEGAKMRDNITRYAEYAV
jgi:hypothetical protein